MIRDSFVFYKSFLDAIECFPDEVQIVLYKAVTGYALNGIEPQLNGAEKGVWALIKPQLDASINRRDLATNGKKRGAPMGNQNARKKTIQNNSKNNSENNSKTIQKQFRGICFAKFSRQHPNYQRVRQNKKQKKQT